MKFDRFLVGVSIVLILASAGCRRQQETPVPASPAVNEIPAATTVLATIADDERLQAAPVEHEASFASQNHPSSSFIVTFSESGRGAAYVIQKGNRVCVVHNQSRGKEYSDVGAIVLSSDGRRIAYGALADGKWRMVVDGREGRRYDTLLSPIFSPDGKHVAYQAKEGEKWYIVMDSTPNAGTTASYTTPEFSSDSTLIAYVESAASSSGMRLIVSD